MNLPLRLVICVAALAPAPLAFAQSAPAPAPAAAAPAKKPGLNDHPKSNPYQSPLETIMQTRLWTDVPPAENFVKESRPDAKSLDYVPLTGKDPERTKPRDADGVAALQAELEAGRAANEKRAKGVHAGGQADAARPRKPKKTAKVAPKKPAPVAD